MVRSDITFEIKNDRRLFSPLISYLQECLANLGALDEAERTRIGVALEEALVNAAEHGNLELDSALRASDRRAYVDLADQRRGCEPYRDRRVYVEAHLSRSEARFIVRDEGSGFDPGTLPDPRDPENLLKVSGRGVLIMRTFMDQVRFNPDGNEVTLVNCAPLAAQRRSSHGYGASCACRPSAIYTYGPEQAEAASRSREAYGRAREARTARSRPRSARREYYFAEDYHQQYLALPWAAPGWLPGRWRALVVK